MAFTIGRIDTSFAAASKRNPEMTYRAYLQSLGPLAPAYKPSVEALMKKSEEATESAKRYRDASQRGVEAGSYRDAHTQEVRAYAFRQAALIVSLTDDSCAAEYDRIVNVGSGDESAGGFMSNAEIEKRRAPKVTTSSFVKDGGSDYVIGIDAACLGVSAVLESTRKEHGVYSTLPETVAQIEARIREEEDRHNKRMAELNTKKREIKCGTSIVAAGQYPYQELKVENEPGTGVIKVSHIGGGGYVSINRKAYHSFMAAMRKAYSAGEVEPV